MQSNIAHLHKHSSYAVDKVSTWSIAYPICNSVFSCDLVIDSVYVYFLLQHAFTHEIVVPTDCGCDRYSCCQNFAIWIAKLTKQYRCRLQRHSRTHLGKSVWMWNEWIRWYTEKVGVTVLWVILHSIEVINTLKNVDKALKEGV